MRLNRTSDLFSDVIIQPPVSSLSLKRRSRPEDVWNCLATQTTTTHLPSAPALTTRRSSGD